MALLAKSSVETTEIFIVVSRNLARSVIKTRWARPLIYIHGEQSYGYELLSRIS